MVASPGNRLDDGDGGEWGRGTIRVSTDPGAATCDLSFTIGTTTLYINRSRRRHGGRIRGRVPVDGLPAGWLALAANPAAAIVTGDPFEDESRSSPDGRS
jgi:hypothetical protein